MISLFLFIVYHSVICFNIDHLLEQLSTEELGMQLDMFQGDLFASHGRLDWSLVEEQIKDGMVGVIHDFKAPPYILNQLQAIAIEKHHGIPILVIEECLHGLLAGNRTVFPQAIALAATFNKDTVQKVGQAIAREARASGIHFCLSPVLDLARDPRWGRVEETFGECPYLTAEMGVAIVNGLQHNGDLENGVVAEIKHFAQHGSPAGGRNAASNKEGEREMKSVYLVPFREAVTTSGAMGVMAAYNEIDGIPNAANRYLLSDVLRKEWGFSGVVVSDLGAISMLFNSHLVAQNSADALKQFHSAGGNIQFYDIEHGQYMSDVLYNLESDPGYINILKQRVRELLSLKERLKLFQNPFVNIKESENQVNRPETQRLALEASKESVILLKNEKNLLPLDYNKLKQIAVIGPNAAVLRTGDYTPDYYNNQRTSILSGIKELVRKNATILHVPGCDISNDMEMVVISSEFLSSSTNQKGFKARYFHKKSDFKPAFARLESEIAASWYLWAPRHNNIEIDDADDFYVEWEGNLTPDVTVRGYIGLQIDGNESGAKLFINDIDLSSNFCEIVLEQEPKNVEDDGDFFKHWKLDSASLTRDGSCLIRQGPSFIFPFSFAKDQVYKIRIEYKKNGTKGGIRLVWNIVGSHGIEDAIEAAANSDVAIVVLGDNDDTMGENRDRETLTLYGKQEELLKSVHETGTPTILVLSNGRPPQIVWASENIPAIVEAFYGGQYSGHAVAKVLFGEYNPAGRLPVSFPRSVGSLPVYYNGPPTFYSRNYVDGNYDPVYPFGYGLSYTQFEYKKFDCFPKSVKIDELDAVLHFTLDVRNSGSRDGDEVVQLYRLGHVSSTTVPKKQLFGFKRIHIPAGESVTIDFVLRVHKWLGIFNRSMNWVLEPGERVFVVGPNSREEWGKLAVIFQ